MSKITATGSIENDEFDNSTVRPPEPDLPKEPDMNKLLKGIEDWVKGEYPLLKDFDLMEVTPRDGKMSLELWMEVKDEMYDMFLVKMIKNIIKLGADGNDGRGNVVRNKLQFVSMSFLNAKPNSSKLVDAAKKLDDTPRKYITREVPEGKFSRSIPVDNLTDTMLAEYINMIKEERNHYPHLFLVAAYQLRGNHAKQDE